MKLKALAGVVVVAALGWYFTSSTARAQVVGSGNADRAPQSVAEFEELFEQVSNWGRWGEDDELGLWNLVTPEKVKAAAALVQEGITVSLAHTLETEAAADQPNAPGAPLGPFDMTMGGSKFSYFFHSTTHSHYDAICQFDYQGQLYNGFQSSEVKGPDGCTKSGAEVNKNGFTTRGVLYDIPRLKGVPYLDPGTPVYPEDLIAWEEQTGVKAGPGDAIFLRTGRWQRREEIGPWNLIPQDPEAGEAGYHISTVQWMRDRDVMMIAADVSNDVRPSGVPEEVRARVRGMPVHSLTIVAMGAYIVDAVDLEEVAETAAELNRWEFMLTGAPTAAEGATGALLNLVALF
jgi:kynurenine formamidase